MVVRQKTSRPGGGGRQRRQHLVEGRDHRKKLDHKAAYVISDDSNSDDSGAYRRQRHGKAAHPTSRGMKRLERKKYEYGDDKESSGSSASEAHNRRLSHEGKVGKAESNSPKSESKKR